MKLNNLESECLFDDIPKLYDPKNKVFITHLHHLDDMIAPKKFPKMITTFALANKMKNYFAKKQVTCDNFVILKTYKTYEIKLSCGTRIKILLCDGNDYTNNLMVLIRKNNQESYIYINMFTQIRMALLNKTFTKWIRHGIQELYLNLKQAGANPEPDAMDKDFQKIVLKLISDKYTKIHLLIPVFGYENFIAKLLKRLPKLVHLNDEHQTVMGDKLVRFELCNDPNEARICIVTKFIAYDPHIYRMSLIDINVANVECLEWSPLPQPFDLKLFTRLLQPQHVYGILNIYTMERQIPPYLKPLLRKPTTISKTPKKSAQADLTVNNALKPIVTTSKHRKALADSALGPNFVRIVPNLYYVDQNSEASDSC